MFRLSPRAGVCLLLPLALLPTGAMAQQTPDTSGDVIARIKDEGLNRSQVMHTLSYLTDVIGPRLTGSPSLKRANTWTCDTMTEWGLQNAHLEAWGPFGKGWELERFSAQVTSPQNIPLIAYPKAWSPGLKGVKAGEVVYLDAKTPADLDKYKGRLKGAIVLTAPVVTSKRISKPLARVTQTKTCKNWKRLHPLSGGVPARVGQAEHLPQQVRQPRQVRAGGQPLQVVREAMRLRTRGSRRRWLRAKYNFVWKRARYCW